MSVEGIQAAAPRAGYAAGKTLSAMEKSSSGVRVAVGAAHCYIPGIPRRKKGVQGKVKGGLARPRQGATQ
jgi:hypothetical protein